jgi:hypothetical protein
MVVLTPRLALLAVLGLFAAFSLALPQSRSVIIPLILVLARIRIRHLLVLLPPQRATPKIIPPRSLSFSEGEI